MNKEEYEILKAKFFKLFASVPTPLRGEIIAVVDDEPISWAVAYLELKEDTGKAKTILSRLKQIGLLELKEKQ